MTAYDYMNWDLLESFDVMQAATLWAGYDPTEYPTSVPSDAYPVSIALKQAIYSRNLTATGFPLWEASNFNDIPDSARIARVDLLEFAYSKNQKPEFLFPSERIPF